MEQTKLFVFCIFTFFIFGGSAEDQKNLDLINQLRFLLNLRKTNTSINQNTASVTHYQFINSTFITINNYNHCTSNTSNSTKVKKDQNESSTTDGLNQSKPGLSDQCASNRDCFDVPYSICLFGRCSCKDNYLATNGRCLGMIGEACEENTDCKLISSSCQSGYCTCKTDLYPAENKKCYFFAKVLGDFCKSNLGCRDIQHSTCSNNSCHCEHNYQRQGNLCLGSMNAFCSADQDCAINFVCQQNTCQCPQAFDLQNNVCYTADKCPINYIYRNEQCYRYFERTYVPANTIIECQGVPNTTFANGFCQCLPTYWLNSEKSACYPTKISNFGTNPQFEENDTLSYPDSYYYNSTEKTAYRLTKSLWGWCQRDQQCTVPFSECSNGHCKCKQGYAENDGVCYGLPGAKCNSPENCASIWWTCESGTCEPARTHQDAKELSTKPGATAYWQQYKDVSDGQDLFNRTKNSQVEMIAGNLAWVRHSRNLNDAVLYDELSEVDALHFYCRILWSNGKFILGKMKPPNYQLCGFDCGRATCYSDQYWLLIDKH